jgi:hypothetical protein
MVLGDELVAAALGEGLDGLALALVAVLVGADVGGRGSAEIRKGWAAMSGHVEGVRRRMR